MQELYIENIYVDTITAPFVELTSLRLLDVRYINIEFVSDCVKVENLFNGLHKLEYLSFIVNGQFCSNYNICSLASLNSLDLTNGNLKSTDKCLRKIPLRTLHFFLPPDGKPIYPPYDLLPHLTSLSIYSILADVPGALKTLQLLNSPLQELILDFQTDLTLNSTTFEHIC